MAIQYVGGKLHTQASGSGAFDVSLTDLTGGLDSAPAADDLVLVGVSIPSGSSGNLDVGVDTSGYVEVADLYADDGSNTNLGVFRKVMGGTPDTVVSISRPNTAVGYSVHVRVYRGVDTTTPMDVAATTATGTNTGRPNPPSITPSTSGAWIVIFGGNATGGTNNDFTASDLTDVSSTAAALEFFRGRVGAGHKTDWTSGAFDGAQWGGGNTATSDSWAAVSMALRPAATTPATANPTGVAGTGAVGTVSAAGHASAAATGVSATGAAGTASAVGATGALTTGVSSSGAVGTLTATGAAAALPGAVTATGAAGDVAATSAALIVVVDGAAAAAGVGSVGAVIPVIAEAAGVAAIGGVGTPLAFGATGASAAGVEGTGAVGVFKFLGVSGKRITESSDQRVIEGDTPTPRVTEDYVEPILVDLSGVSGASAVGTVAVGLSADAPLDGVAAAGGVGVVSVEVITRATLAGVAAAGAVGSLLATGAAVAPLSGVGATGEPGGADLTITRFAYPVGVSADGAAGTIVAIGGATVVVPGASATGEAGTPVGAFAIVVPLTGAAATASPGAMSAVGLDARRPRVIFIE